MAHTYDYGRQFMRYEDKVNLRPQQQGKPRGTIETCAVLRRDSGNKLLAMEDLVGLDKVLAQPAGSPRKLDTARWYFAVQFFLDHTPRYQSSNNT